MKTIEEKVKELRGGSFTRVAYKSELPLKADYRKSGCKIEKVTEKTCRLGINYLNINKVKEMKEINGEPTRKVANNFEWVIPNRIAYNTKTGKKYLAITNYSKPYVKVKYIVTDDKLNVKTVSKLDSEDVEMVIPSYFSSNEEMPIVQKVLLENVLSVNHDGKECFV